MSLCWVFPLLFRLAVDEDCTVAAGVLFFSSPALDFCSTTAGFWRRSLKLDEQSDLKHMLALLTGVRLSNKDDAFFKWKPTKKTFTSKSFLELMVVPLEDDDMDYFANCWNLVF